MTNEEMQKTMEFIVKMQKQTDIKLGSLSKNAGGKRVQIRAEKRWKETEKGIQALLAKARSSERKRAAERKRLAEARASLPSRNTAVDKRLQALADLVERQIRERRKATKRKP